MKVKRSSIKKDGKVIWTSYEPANSFYEKFKGIMLRNRISAPLLFTFNYMHAWSIHSFFCKFDFDAIFLDDKKKIVTIARSVKPWTVSVTPKSCLYLIEATSGESTGLEVGDVLEWQ